MTLLPSILADLASGPASAAYVTPGQTYTRQALGNIHATRRHIVGLILSEGINGDDSARMPSHTAGRFSDAYRRWLHFREQAFADEMACIVLRNNVIAEQRGAFDA